MADNNTNANLEQNAQVEKIKENIEVVTNTNETMTSDTDNDALKSFLEREQSSTKTQPDDKKKISKSLLWVIIGCVAVVIIIGLVVLLKTLPTSQEEKGFDEGTEMSATVDQTGEHQVKLALNSKGEVENNSYGTLIAYTPSDIKQIDIENESGTYTILAETPKEKDSETGEETTGATVYTLVGYEDMSLQSGGVDTIADDVAAIDFTSVADATGKNSKQFGFDSPRSTVVTQFNDGTTSTVIVGDEAPNDAGTYIKFGNNDAIFVIDNEAADGFLFSILDLMDLNVNTAAADTDSAEFESLTLSGSAFKESIEIRPNSDKAIDSTYQMISPEKMFISEVEASNIAGGIRGLYADKAVCVNPSADQLKKYGLSTPYAQVNAIYPDTTVNLKASKSDGDNVYIIGDTDIIYQIAVTAVPWVNTSVDKLRPDIVIDPNFSSLSRIVITDNSSTYTFDVTTTVDTVTNTEGTEEEVENTTCEYKGKKLDSDNFKVFYQNICNMQNAGNTENLPSGSPILTIELSYSTGRATDVIKVYDSGNSKCVATLNGNVQCLVYKSYCTKFSNSVQELITGKTVSSF